MDAAPVASSLSFIQLRRVNPSGLSRRNAAPARGSKACRSSGRTRGGHRPGQVPAARPRRSALAPTAPHSADTPLALTTHGEAFPSAAARQRPDRRGRAEPGSRSQSATCGDPRGSPRRRPCSGLAPAAGNVKQGRYRRSRAS